VFKNVREKNARIISEILILALLTALSAVFVYPLQKTMLDALRSYRDALLERVERETGFAVSYESMNPSIFGTLDLRNIRVFKRGQDRNTEKPALSIERLRVKYSFWELLTARNIHSILAVHIERPLITLDSGKALSELFTGKGGTAGGGAAAGGRGKRGARPSAGEEEKKDGENLLSVIRGYIHALPEDFQFRVTRGEARVLFHEDSAAFESFSLNVFTRGNTLELKADWNATVRIGAEGKQAVFHIPANASGVFDIDDARGDFNLYLPELTSDLFTLRKTRFLAVLTGENLFLRKIDDRLPYDISFSLDYGGGTDYQDLEFYANLNAERFSLQEILTLNGPLSRYNAYLSTQLSGSGSLQKTRSGGLSYTLDFSGLFQRGSPVGGGAFELKASGDAQAVTVRDISFALPQGGISWQGRVGFAPFRPAGTLRFNAFHLIPNADSSRCAPLNGSVEFSSDSRLISAFAPELHIGGTPLSALDIEALRVRGGGWRFSLSALRFHDVETYSDVRISRVNGSAELRGETDKNLSLSLSLDSFRLADILNIVGLGGGVPRENPLVAAVGNAAAFTGDIEFSTDFTHFSYKIPRLVTVYSGLNELIAVSQIEGTDARFELSESHIAFKDGIDLRASADFADSNDVSFELAASLSGLNYETRGRFINKRDLVIDGNYGLNARFSFGGAGGTRGMAAIDAMPLPFLSPPAVLNAAADFTFSSPEYWKLSLITLDVQHRDGAEGAEPFFHIAGAVNQDKAELRELALGEGDERVSGDAAFYFKNRGTRGENDYAPDMLLRLASADGGESLRFEGRKHEDSFDLHLNAKAFRLSRFFMKDAALVLSGSFDAGIEPERFYSAFDIESLSGKLGRTDWTLSSKGSLTEDKLEVGETFIRHGGIEISVPYISVDRAQGSLDTAALLSGLAAEHELSARLAVQARFARMASWGDLQTALQALSGEIQVSDAYFINAADRDEFDFTFSKDNNILRVSGGPGEMLDAEIDTTGKFYANLISPSPVQGAVVGTVSGGELYVQASNIFVDLEDLLRFIPPSSPVFGTGGVVFADFTISGSVSDPNFWGAAQGYGVKLKIPRFLGDEIGPATLTASLNGDSILFDPVLARVGKGEGYVTGSFQFDHWTPRNFEIDISVMEDKPLPYNITIHPVVSSGLVSGKLNLLMEENTFTIKGDLKGSDSTISLSSETPPPPAPEDKPLVVQTDITITADRKVEFLWPSVKLPILRANIDAGDVIQIKSDSLAEKFSLIGTIHLRSGEIYYFQRSFYIKEGELVFNESEAGFEPRLSVTAESRDQNQDGPVRIIILVEDQPLSSFTPRIISEPALSQVEILSLLGNAVSGAPDGENNVRQLLLDSTADVLAQITLLRRFEHSMRDLLHIDMFSARTQALQNVLLQAVMPDSENAETRIGTYFDNTTVFTGKYIGSEMFVQAMVSSRYDKNKLNMSGLSFEVDIGIELTSPLFNIRWDITPRHENSLWVEDVRITLQRTWHLP
jgi:hypothetical protein